MRRQARELALQVLFQTEFSQQVPVSQILGLYDESVAKESIDYADVLVRGVLLNKPEIDRAIQDSSSHWKMERMALVDRNLLRLACFELEFAQETVKPNIAINEAVEIAKKYGTADSASFVNGVLDQVAKRFRRN